MATPHSRGASGYELDAMSFAAMSFAAMSSSAVRKRDRLEALAILNDRDADARGAPQAWLRGAGVGLLFLAATVLHPSTAGLALPWDGTKLHEQMWADGRRLFQTVHGLARPTTNAGRQASAGSTAVVSAWVEAPCVPRGTCQVVSPAGQHQLAGADGTGAGREPSDGRHRDPSWNLCARDNSLGQGSYRYISWGRKSCTTGPTTGENCARCLSCTRSCLPDCGRRACP